MSRKAEHGVQSRPGKPKGLEAMPFIPPTYTDQIAIAIQMLAEGKANEGQQRMALDWIVNVLCGTYDLSYRPGVDGVRNTDFAEGKRFVGLQIIKMTKIKIGRMQYKEENHEI